jgi:hypothetical protein
MCTSIKGRIEGNTLKKIKSHRNKTGSLQQLWF